MKLNQIMFGLCFLMIAAHMMGLPISAPIIVILAYPFIAYAFGFVRACVMAVVHIIASKALEAEALKATAKVVCINESLAGLRHVIYGDKPSTFILNDRSDVFKQQFDELTALEPTAQFEVKSCFGFGNSDKIIHTVEAKTPHAVAMLTSLKNGLLKKGADLNFS
jgi:hypothetical protein